MWEFGWRGLVRFMSFVYLTRIGLGDGGSDRSLNRSFGGDRGIGDRGCALGFGRGDRGICDRGCVLGFGRHPCVRLVT